jgi:hypothetical protein
MLLFSEYVNVSQPIFVRVFPLSLIIFAPIPLHPSQTLLLA